MSSGWIKIHRKMLDWVWYEDTNAVRLFFHLLLKANHEPKNWQGITIQPGQLVTSRSSLALETRLSEDQVRTQLKHLKTTGEITIKTTSRYSIVTLENWKDYQQNPQPNPQQIPGPLPTTKEERSIYINHVLENQNPNMTNVAWIDGYFRVEGERLKKEYTLTDHQLFTCWRDTWDKGLTEGIGAPNWFKKVLESICAKFHTKTAYPTSKPREVADSWAGIPRA